MKVPPVDLSHLRERYRELATRVHELWESSNLAHDDVDTPELLRDAMSQLIDMLRLMGTDESPADSAEINTVGEYGLHLIDELAQVAASLEQTRLASEIEHLAMPFALWIARHGGEIRHLQPVVNALAHYANQVSHPQEMAALYTQCCELIDAVSPACEDASGTDPQHPWRLLLLNRAIVATRSHNPELMEPAFDAVVEMLPNDARGFFAEGMEQIAIIDYPEAVRDVIRRYFLMFASSRRLH